MSMVTGLYRTRHDAWHPMVCVGGRDGRETLGGVGGSGGPPTAVLASGPWGVGPDVATASPAER
jgi:hypothetical protein